MALRISPDKWKKGITVSITCIDKDLTQWLYNLKWRKKCSAHSQYNNGKGSQRSKLWLDLFSAFLVQSLLWEMVLYFATSNIIAWSHCLKK